MKLDLLGVHYISPHTGEPTAVCVVRYPSRMWNQGLTICSRLITKTNQPGVDGRAFAFILTLAGTLLPREGSTTSPSETAWDTRSSENILGGVRGE